VASTIHQSLAVGDCVGPGASGKYSKVRVVQAETRIESAWFQHLKLTYDELLSKIAFNSTCAPARRPPPSMRTKAPARRRWTSTFTTTQCARTLIFLRTAVNAANAAASPSQVSVGRCWLNR